jgi:hypothetical protein
MANTVYMVITDSGDGSNGVQWVLDEKVIDRMEEMVDEGDESYSSGDGLQLRELTFPDGFDIPAWLKLNYLNVVTLKDLDY